ncbi:MAG: hypothetical protein NWE93_02865 [Candidatus Bathyarchaeota archaeon]|nr:hypothetical protein [Candidatus Bathyarchaeota archaeon]
MVVVLLVVLALGIGVIVGLTLNGQPPGGNASPNSTPSPIPTRPSPTPTPLPTQAVTPPPGAYVTVPDNNVTVTYSEHSRQTNEAADTTTVVLTVEAQYAGEAVTLSYNRFVLSILTSRGGLEPYPIYLQSALAYPKEAGSVTVSQANPQASFTLSFEFSTHQQSSQDGMLPFHSYELKYT